MSEAKAAVPYGALDLLALETLDSMGPLNGYRITRRIEQLSENVLELNRGSIYLAPLRLEQKGWIAANWGVSETGRKVKIYSITKRGHRQLEAEVENWGKTTALVARFLRQHPQGVGQRRTVALRLHQRVDHAAHARKRAALGQVLERLAPLGQEAQLQAGQAELVRGFVARTKSKDGRRWSWSTNAVFEEKITLTS